MGTDERGVLKRQLAAGTVLAVVLSSLGTHACYQQITAFDAGQDGGHDEPDAGTDAGSGTLAWSEITPSDAGADKFCGISGSPDGSVVYVLANDGALFARRGEGWVPVADHLWSGSATRCGVYADPEGRVFAAGGTQLLACDGGCDSRDASYAAFNAGVTVLSVCGRSGSAFATTLQSGSGYRYDAGSWELTAIRGGLLYRGCWMRPDGTVFIGSSNGIVLSLPDGGTDYTRVTDSPAQEHRYEEVWGIGDEVFAVGGFNSAPDAGELSVIRRNPDVSWVFMYQDAGTFLNAIAGTGSGDIYAGGLYDPDGGNILLHYDGGQWMRVSTPDMPAMDIVGLWGVTPTEYYAIGRCYRDGGFQACVVKSKPQ